MKSTTTSTISSILLICNVATVVDSFLLPSSYSSFRHRHDISASNHKLKRIEQCQSSSMINSLQSLSNSSRSQQEPIISSVYNSASSMPYTEEPNYLLDESQIDFTIGYMNKHHSDALIKLVQVFTPLGREQMKKNAFSGGSFEIVDAKLIGIDCYLDDGSGDIDGFLTVEASVDIRGKKGPTLEIVKISLDAEPIEALHRLYPNQNPIKSKQLAPKLRPINYMNQFIRRLNRLCNIIKESKITGKLTQLAYQKGGDKNLILKENLYLNQVPHNTFVRNYFYDMASEALLDAVVACSDGLISNRMKMTVLFPEMNPQMDSYRIGTLLEIARSMTITLAEQNLRVRVCVQGSMGVGIFTGTPKALSGASTLLQRMDWQSNGGEQNEGMVGNFVNFGAVGKEHVVNAGTDRSGNKIEQDDVFIIICPQSMVGVDSSIIGPLSEMVEAAGDRPVILLNPDLVDKVSSQGQQNIRGRKERIEFAESFKTVFHFQNIYISGTSYFPILGAVTKTGYDEPWIAYQRRDRIDGEGEIYVPVLSSEYKPDGESILKSFD